MIDLNSTFQQIRENFADQSKKYQHIFDDQLSDIRKNTGAIGKVVLIGGAAFLAGYLITRNSFKGGNKHKNKDFKNGSSMLPTKVKPAKQSAFMKLFWESITMFLLAIAKKKLEEFLASTEKHDTAKSVN